MSTLLEQLSGQLGTEQVQAIAKRLGSTPEQTQAAIAAALPTLLGAMGRHAETEAGAHQIHAAVSQAPAESSIMDMLNSVGGLSGLGNMLGMGSGSQAAPAQPASIPGADILGSLLGNKQNKVSDAIGKSSGMNASQVGPLLGMLAPMLISALGSKTQGKMGPTDLAGMLNGEKQAMEKSASTSFVGRLLDQDGDGDFDLGDVMKLGMSKLFGKK
jgi:hypothetical protein